MKARAARMMQALLVGVAMFAIASSPGCGGGGGGGGGSNPTPVPTPAPTPSGPAGAGVKAEILSAEIAEGGQVTVMFTLTDDVGEPITATLVHRGERPAGARALHHRAPRGVCRRRRPREHVPALRQRGERDASGVRPQRHARARRRRAWPLALRVRGPGHRRGADRHLHGRHAGRPRVRGNRGVGQPGVRLRARRRHADGLGGRDHRAVQRLPPAADRARQPPRGASLHAVPHLRGDRREGHQHRPAQHDPHDPRRQAAAVGGRRSARLAVRHLQRLRDGVRGVRAEAGGRRGHGRRLPAAARGVPDVPRGGPHRRVLQDQARRGGVRDLP